MCGFLCLQPDLLIGDLAVMRSLNAYHPPESNIGVGMVTTGIPLWSLNKSTTITPKTLF